MDSNSSVLALLAEQMLSEKVITGQQVKAFTQSNRDTVSACSNTTSTDDSTDFLEGRLDSITTNERKAWESWPTSPCGPTFLISFEGWEITQIFPTDYKHRKRPFSYFVLLLNQPQDEIALQ